MALTHLDVGCHPPINRTKKKNMISLTHCAAQRLLADFEMECVLACCSCMLFNARVELINCHVTTLIISSILLFDTVLG